ncbi:Transmembrane domain-containing protein [Cedratvirus Zaza IHUMI]|uniref:Transmembrane domain-containing protein n=1 Tax=Cedratvirus Zaza IHUMI TaxID=2126979 RepID=A0A2R8FDJ7_9VIRU|nr:Transmembrane domain-containing protein [Cedratvirus Zaza IHUMI]
MLTDGYVCKEPLLANTTSVFVPKIAFCKELFSVCKGYLGFSLVPMVLLRAKVILGLVWYKVTLG